MIPNNSAQIISPQQPEGAHYIWLDVIRLLAMAMVAVHHVLTLHNVQLPARWNPGSLGVSLFCVISGYLAAPKTRSCRISVALKWFCRRYLRLMPAYWLTLGAVLIANQFIKYKPVSTGLVASEFLGIHWYTHGSAIIGIHFWFISLILTCFCLTILVRFDQRFLFPLLLISGAVVFVEPLHSMHFLTYLVGLDFGLHASRYLRMVMIIVLFALGIFVEPAFLYPAIAVVVLTPLRFLPASSSCFSKALATWSQGTYEFYLVHGPVYLGFTFLDGSGILANAAIGTGVAVMCAIALRQIIDACGSRIRKPPALADDYISDSTGPQSDQHKEIALKKVSGTLEAGRS